MQHLQVLEGALMGDVPKTCTRSPSKRKASTKSNNRNEDDVDMGDLDNFPSTSIVNQKKVSHGVDVEDMDGSRISGLLFAQQMLFYSPEQEMANIVQHAQHVDVKQQTVVGKDGDKQDKKEEDEEDEEEEEVEVEEEEEEGGDGNDDRMVDETRKAEGPNERRGPSSDTTHVLKFFCGNFKHS
ncbi:hypothetical protein RHGRI_014578 [Rhododendron griersonianum]|uniref:Uncharacterized protein n=1 Tax=Rhododendron griersonianum TaxID=479676 RepID=A0AAV6KAH5_9ERIC|nr:hypothetical protein RHGRI_014578 [Rhododendron griersonianum]